MSIEDPYWKLRPPSPLPTKNYARVLMRRRSCCAALSVQTRSLAPAATSKCDPKDSGCHLAEALAAWRSFHDCFYLLWLDSAELEDWGRAQLSDPTSPVNSRGLGLRQRLEPIRRTFFWWFQDVGAAEFRPLTACPICRSNLLDRKLVGRVCDDCSVLVAN
jgi:predicted  nucleic acid-binding Zn ribbon protein